MCVIIINQTKSKVSAATLQKAATINADGLGIIWLDDYSIEYHESSEFMRLHTERPFIGHFRYATVGKVGRSNTHPFACGNNEFLFHNGTIKGLGNDEECDSKVFAKIIGGAPRKEWATRMLAYQSRFVTANIKTKSFQMYNKSLWSRHNGVWFSKDNVLPRKSVKWSPQLSFDSQPSQARESLVGVYGTLKTGQHNNGYMNGALSLGIGHTSNQYPLIIAGLPYLINEEGVGHNVEVEVFSVDDQTLRRLDMLEGHPTWYKRERVLIEMESGDTLSVWVYFNIEEKVERRELHDRYPANSSEVGTHCSLCYSACEFDGYSSYQCSGCGDSLTEAELVVM